MMSSLHARHILAVICFGFIFTMPASSQSIEEEFQGIPWGSNVDFVKSKARGTLKSENIIPRHHEWNTLGFCPYSKMVLAPQSSRLTFTGRYAEKTIYFFTQDRLCMVSHHPPYTQSFDAKGYVQQLKRRYKKVQDPSKEYIGTLALPNHWGEYNMRSEYPYTMEWESDAILIRVGCKSWPGKELREIKGVIYSSKKQRALNEKILFRIKTDNEKKKLKKEAEKEN